MEKQQLPEDFKEFIQCLNSKADLVDAEKLEYSKSMDLNQLYSKTNMNVLKKSIKQLEEGKGVEHELIE